MENKPDQLRGAIYGLLAAALFGVSAPAAKLLLRDATPFVLAGLLYTGAAIGLWGVKLSGMSRGEASLRRADVPKLALMTACGGVAAPVLMLLGLSRVSGMSGSLLLNLEAPFTMLFAIVFFKEHLGRRATLAAALIMLGALALKLEPGELKADPLGILFIAGACACWGVDNNLTQRLSIRDPFEVVRLKASGSGLTNLLVGLYLVRGHVPSAGIVLSALALGSVSYGASVVLDAYALRLVGAAREAAYFATAPFLGALAAVLILGERPGSADLLAMIVMAAGVALLISEKHDHLHTHEPLEHEHRHTHDEHHRHQHDDSIVAGEAHSHPHRHAPIRHDHAHVPDLHHRHPH